MKKFFKIIGITFLCLMIVGQIVRTVMRPAMQRSMEKTAFERMIERADKDCPIQVALGKGALTGIKLENGFVTYYLSYDNDFRNILSTLRDEDKIKEGIIMCFLCINAQGNNNGDLVMDILIRENCGLKVIVTESATGRFECCATVDEIKSLRNRFRLNPHEALYNLLTLSVEAERSSLPMQIDEGMYMSDYQLDSDNIIITIKLDESIYSIDNMIGNRNLMKATILSEGQRDPDSKAFLDLCKVSHTGLVYVIKGNRTHKSFDIVISSDEIRQTVKTPSNLHII